MSLVIASGQSGMLTRAQLIARLLASDGPGSGVEADIVMARRPRLAFSSFNGFPHADSGLAASPLDPASVVARANFGA